MAKIGKFALTNEGIGQFWLAQIQKGKDIKKTFDADLANMEHWHSKRHDHFYKAQGVKAEEYSFIATINKVYEGMRIFMPELMFKAPHKKISSDNEDMKPWCEVQEKLGNKLTKETNWKRACKRSIFEALMGCGAQITQYDPISKLVVNEYLPIKDVFVDPTARNFDEALWIAIRYRKPAWSIRKQFGDKLIKDASTSGSAEEGEKEDESKRDLITYYEIYSKMGVGIRSSDFTDTAKEHNIKDTDYVKLVVSPDLPKQLLAPPSEWDVPFWMDYRRQSWPVSFLYFTERADSLWPMSHFAPALGVQEALDWMVTHILRHVKVTSKEIIVVLSSIDEGLKTAIEEGQDLSIVEIGGAMRQDIRQQIQVLKFNEMNTDIWRSVELLIDIWEKLTGVSDILYGQTKHAYRSAKEAEVKERAARSTPEDMLDIVEDWCGEIIRKEAIACKWKMGPEDIEMLLGQEASQIWEQYQEGDMERLVREIGYSVEVGSSRKPNKQKAQQDADMMYDKFMPIYQGLGAIDKVNMLLKSVAEAYGVENPTQYELIPQDIPPEEGVPGAEQQAPAMA